MHLCNEDTKSFCMRDHTSFISANISLLQNIGKSNAVRVFKIRMTIHRLVWICLIVNCAFTAPLSVIFAVPRIRPSLVREHSCHWTAVVWNSLDDLLRWTKCVLINCFALVHWPDGVSWFLVNCNLVSFGMQLFWQSYARMPAFLDCA